MSSLENGSMFQVNSNGVVSFETDVPNYANVPLPLNFPMIAAFYADVDTTGTGRIFYRESQDVSDLQRASSDIRNHFAGFPEFEASSIFVVTWENVGYYPRNNDRVRTICATYLIFVVKHL